MIRKFALPLLLAVAAIVGEAKALTLTVAPNESLTVAMSGAAATTNPTAYVQYDQNSASKSTHVQLNGATAVTLVTVPDGANLNAAKVNSLLINNNDTAAITLSLKHVVNSTNYTITSVSLAVGDTLQMDTSGLKVLDTNGQERIVNTVTAVQPFAVTATEWRRTDGVTLNTATASSTNHGLVYGTDGTNFPHLETIDSKAATTAVVSRCMFKLPSNYVAGSAITIRVRCGMKTTVADTSCLVALNVYSNAGTAQNGSADLNTTSATSCNSLTNADKDYVITPTGLVAGQDLHIKITQTVTDAATGTAVIGVINHVELRTTVSL